MAQFIAGEDLLWFVDNQAAGSSLIKGASAHQDICDIVSFTHLLFAELGCRAYFDFCESDANPSDGLSRDGIEDAWTQRQGWLLQEAILPDWISLLNADFLQWRKLVALGIETLGQSGFAESTASTPVCAANVKAALSPKLCPSYRNEVPENHTVMMQQCREKDTAPCTEAACNSV